MPSNLKRLFLIGISIAHTTAIAQVPRPPLVGVSTQSPLEIAARAEAVSRKTLAQALDESRPGAENTRLLKQRLEKAQAAWLSESPERSKAKFEQIAKMALDADWTRSQREAIQYSLLRLAQMAASESDRVQWLEQAAHWFADLSPDASLFPPPLLNSLQVVLLDARKTTVEIDLSELFENDRVVLIDGRSVDKTKPLALAMGLHRVTAFSDLYVPFSEVITAEKLKNSSIHRSRFSGSACSQTEVEVPWDKRVIAVELDGPDGCGAEKTLSLQPRLPTMTSELDRVLTAAPNEQTKSSGLSKRTWLWIGLSALAAGAVYVALKEPERKNPSAPPQTQIEPVRRQGF